jgi:flagellar FliJ protein
MKPFQLETVLKYRQRLKDVARNRFQHAQNQRNKAHEDFVEKKNEYQNLNETITELQRHGVAVEELIRYQNRIDYVSAELLKLEETLKKKTETVVRERKHLILKNKEERVLEKLKEKQNLEYQQFINKKESAMLDEIAVLYRSQQESAEPREFQ